MHSFTTTNLLRHVDDVRIALAQEPGIAPSFANASLETIAVVIYCLLFRGIDTKLKITKYLSGHGARYQASDISFVLGAFEGHDPSVKLWTRQPGGAYTPLLAAAPADFDTSPD